jgi:hypothetical protein
MGYKLSSQQILVLFTTGGAYDMAEAVRDYLRRNGKIDGNRANGLGRSRLALERQGLLEGELGGSGYFYTLTERGEQLRKEYEAAGMTMQKALQEAKNDRYKRERK